MFQSLHTATVPKPLWYILLHVLFWPENSQYLILKIPQIALKSHNSSDCWSPSVPRDNIEDMTSVSSVYLQTWYIVDLSIQPLRHSASKQKWCQWARIRREGWIIIRTCPCAVYVWQCCLTVQHGGTLSNRKTSTTAKLLELLAFYHP